MQQGQRVVSARCGPRGANLNHCVSVRGCCSKVNGHPFLVFLSLDRGSSQKWNEAARLLFAAGVAAFCCGSQDRG